MKKIAFQGHGNYLNKKNQHFMKITLHEFQKFVKFKTL